MNEESSVRNCIIRGSLGVSLLGSALHSAYMLLGWSRLALISPINESVWEHLKMGFWAVMLYGWVEKALSKARMQNFYPARAMEITVLMLGIVGIFYGYTAISGRSMLWVDILTFFVCVLASRWVACKVERRTVFPDIWQIAALGYILLLVTLFAWFTYQAPDLGIFRDLSH